MRYLVMLFAVGCTTSATPNDACAYSEQLDKSNDHNTANDVPPAGAEATAIVFNTSPDMFMKVICGAVNQGDYTVHDDNTADGDSYQFTVAVPTRGTLTLSVIGDVPPAPEFRVFILDLTDAMTGYATLGANVPFDLDPGTYIADVEAKQATGPLSQDYPYEVGFYVTP
jgi:hypothetical protein